MSKRIPVIGVTAEIEWREGRPSRPGYTLDARNLKALQAVACAPIMLPHEIERLDAYIHALDGVFITGGGYQFQDANLFPSVLPDGVPEYKYNRTNFEMQLIRLALERRVPLLGVCGGFQVLNRVLGGKLIVSLDEEWPSDVSHCQSGSYTEGSHMVEVSDNSLLSNVVSEKTFLVNSLHKQGVVEAGPRALVAAIAADGVVEAIEVPDHPFAIGTQWHPEFFITPNDGELFEGFVVASQEYRDRK